MEFNEKLQELRKQKGLTQEELAEALFVSRTAISKWESGRGYPNIDSLKAISVFFSVTIDELLSGDEVLMVAEEDNRKRENNIRDLVFGLLDICLCVFLFLPLFGQKINGVIEEVSLVALNAISPWLRTVYFVVVIFTALWGVLTLALQSFDKALWIAVKNKGSLILSAVGTLVFIVSSQPYAASLVFVFMLIKTFMCIKKR